MHNVETRTNILKNFACTQRKIFKVCLALFLTWSKGWSTLTHYQPMFQPLLTSGFLMFSGGIEMEPLLKMVYVTHIPCKIKYWCKWRKMWTKTILSSSQKYLSLRLSFEIYFLRFSTWMNVCLIPKVAWNFFDFLVNLLIPRLSGTRPTISYDVINPFHFLVYLSIPPWKH